MRLIDIFNELTGSNRTAKGKHLELIGQSLLAIEDWIENNIGAVELQAYFNNNPDFNLTLQTINQRSSRHERLRNITRCSFG